MKLVMAAHRFFETKKIQGLVLWLASVFVGCALCYLAGAYLENGGSTGIKIILCVSAFLCCAVSICLQVLVWTSEPLTQFGKFYVNPFVQMLTVDMIALLLCFAIYGPIGFNNPKSFIAISQFAPSAFIFLFLLVSSLLLVAVRARVFERSTSEESHKPVHESFLPWFLVIYFLFLIAPYSFAPVPAINSFLTGSGKIPYRLFTTLLLGIYSLYLWRKHKLSPRFDLLIPMTILWVGFALACAFAPRTFSFVSESFNGSFSFSRVTYGEQTIWIQLALLACDCFVFFCFISFFAPCIADRKQVLIPCLTIVIYVLFSCVFSYVTEFSAYINYFSGGNQSKGAIQSWTQSKNAFGILLFHGAFVSAFLFYYVKKWWRYLFVIADLLFWLTSYIAQCYTAMVPILVICILFFVLITAQLYRKRKWAGLTMGIVGIAGIALICLCAFVPAIYEDNPFFTKMNHKIIYFFEHEIITRTKKWDLSLIVCRGPFAFIGKSSMAEMELYLRESSILDMAYPDFHSSYVAMYGSAGLIGLLMYIFCIGFAMKNVWKCYPNKALSIISSSLLLACILFSMPESYTLLLSMSAISLPFTYIFIVFLPYVRRSETC